MMIRKLFQHRIYPQNMCTSKAAQLYFLFLHVRFALPAYMISHKWFLKHLVAPVF